MIPDQSLSAISVFGLYDAAKSRTASPYHDYEYGGVGMGDTSKGMAYQVWEAIYQPGTGDVLLQADEVDQFVFMNIANATEISFTFDQNMRPQIAFVQDGIAKMYWWDSAMPGYTTTLFPGARSPKIVLDDKHQNQIATSDIILAYLRDTGLYFRAQRERFAQEHLLANDIPLAAKLLKIGMTDKRRLQFMVEVGRQ